MICKPPGCSSRAALPGANYLLRILLPHLTAD